MLNNKLVGLSGPGILAESLADAGMDFSTAGSTSRRLRLSWWNRYQALAAFRDRCEHLFRSARTQHRPLRVIAPDGRWFSFSPAEVAGHQIADLRPVGFPTIFSSIWRAAEGVAVDEAMANIHATGGELGLRLVVPMYDGLVYACPEAAVEQGMALVREALELGMAAIGAPGSAKSYAGVYWRPEFRETEAG